MIRRDGCHNLEDKDHLVCVDFDGTLIKVDSGRIYLLYFAGLKIRFLGATRKLHLIGKNYFRKQLLVSIVEFRGSYPERYAEFLVLLKKNINSQLVALLSYYEKSGHMIIVNSTSEEDLVRDVCSNLEVSYTIGSNKHRLNYGPEKINALITVFPNSKIKYCVGISDNSDDDLWLDYFETFVKIDPRVELEISKLVTNKSCEKLISNP